MKKELKKDSDGLIDILREKYPHGHPKFTELLLDILKLHSEKNHDYASGGDPLGNFKRVAGFLSQYPGLDLGDPAIVATIYSLKQLDAYLWIKANKHETIVEGLDSRLRDEAVYALIKCILESAD